MARIIPKGTDRGFRSSQLVSEHDRSLSKLDRSLSELDRSQYQLRQSQDQLMAQMDELMFLVQEFRNSKNLGQGIVGSETRNNRRILSSESRSESRKPMFDFTKNVHQSQRKFDFTGVLSMPKATPLSSMSEATPMRSDLSSSSSSNEYRKRLRSHQTPTRVTVRRSPRFHPQITKNLVEITPNPTKEPSSRKTHLRSPPVSPNPTRISSPKKTQQRCPTKCLSEPLRSINNLQGSLRRSRRLSSLPLSQISNGSNKENVGIENFGVELVKEKNNGEKKRGERDGLVNLKIFEKKENVGVENLGAKIVKEKDNFEKRRGEKDGLVNFKNKENVGIGNFGVKMEKEKNNVEKKRKMERCCEEGIQSCGSDDWTRQQEAALQRAYLAAKPSPHFWKKVAKMVPGKSAQDCFDRVNSSFDTPPQPQPRSRAIKSKLSPISNFSLSCSKPIQNPSQPVKKLSSRKKSLVAQKTVRHFLKKHSEKDQNHQVDHFSVLETSPDALVVDLLEINSHIDPTCPLSPPNFLQKCSGGLSSGHQKMLSRFKPNNPSPEVLKRVKNVALHEKYIDQLHNRDARRKSVAARVCKNVDEVKIGGLKAAKTALMSEAREFISQFQHMRANCQCDADIDDDDDEEMEEEDDE